MIKAYYYSNVQYYFLRLKLSYADLAFFDFMNSSISRGKLEIPEILNKFPALREHYSRVMNEPNILAWLEKRPKTEA